MDKDCILKTAIQENVFDLIVQERQYQDTKWGLPHQHEVGGWLTLMQVHLNKAQEAWASSKGNVAALDELRKIIALGVACAEEYGMPPRVSNDEKHIT